MERMSLSLINSRHLLPLWPQMERVDVEMGGVSIGVVEMAVNSRTDNSDFKITSSQVCNWGLREEPSELLEAFQPHIYGLGG